MKIRGGLIGKKKEFNLVNGPNNFIYKNATHKHYLKIKIWNSKFSKYMF